MNKYIVSEPEDTRSMSKYWLLGLEVDGEWGAWTSWSVCRCDNVPRTRTRQCNSPPPSNGGSYCSGSSTDYLSCNTRGCPGEPGKNEIHVSSKVSNRIYSMMVLADRWSVTPTSKSGVNEVCI